MDNKKLITVTTSVGIWVKGAKNKRDTFQKTLVINHVNEFIIQNTNLKN